MTRHFTGPKITTACDCIVAEWNGLAWRFGVSINDGVSMGFWASRSSRARYTWDLVTGKA